MFGFWWRNLLTIFSISVVCVAINRPVYKIVLNSKRYVQFIQYDMDVPPLSELTLCVWVRVTSVESDQSIFTYVGADDKRIMRLWLDSGGRRLRIALEDDRVAGSAAVEFAAGAWRDVCVSYQSDHGVWAMYVDAKLISCQGSRYLRGFEFPGKGRLIIGYGTSEKGLPTGLTGEIYGASMLSLSTIERNITIDPNNWNRLEPRLKNQHISNEGDQYIVLGDLQNDDIQTVNPRTINKEYDFLSSDNMKIFSRPFTNAPVPSNEHKHEFSIDENLPSNKKGSKKDFNQTFKNKKIKAHHEFKKELTGSGTQDLPIVLEYETPPNISALTSDYSMKIFDNGKTASAENHLDDIMISDVEKPPPPIHDPNVYGQWTSSNFATNVLNYLKNINFNTNRKQKKVKSIFHDGKLSDLYPYPSELTHTIIRPPINYKKRIHSTKKNHYMVRRDIKEHQINVKIINPDASVTISPLKNVDPKLIEVTNRGKAKSEFKTSSLKNKDIHFGSEEMSSSQNSLHKRQFDSINTSERHRGTDFMKIIPFLTSNEHFIINQQVRPKNTKTKQPFTFRISSNNANDQWRGAYERMLDKANTSKHMKGRNGDSLIAGRALAKEVSDQAKPNIYSFPLLKYKLDPITPTSNNIAVAVVNNDYDGKQESNQINFNKQVKLGNALNEKFIGFDVHQIKNTFLGGNDATPDINRYRSKSNSKKVYIPASLETRVCKNVELYVHKDETIGKSKIESPIKKRNIGIEFVVQSYKRCSTTESPLKNSPFLIIDWIRTPIKLFGGAYAKKTKDLCGFF